MCFRHVLSVAAFEYQDTTTVAYLARDYRPYASIQVFSGSQDSNTIDYLTWYNSRNNAPQVLPVVVVLRTKLRLFFLSRTVAVARYVSERYFRLDAFGNQHSTTVVYSTWYCRRYTSTQMFSTVIVLRIELRHLYLSRTVVAARYVSDACFRLEAFENQHSSTVAYLKWDYRPNASIQEFSVVIVQRTELRQLYISRTVAVARCASDTCFRIEAFENQDSTTVANSTCDYRRNTPIQEFSVVIVLRIALRLLYISRTVIVARCASDMCFRIEAY
ncbi:hypothetical protein ANTQUA_LOCUS6932 [Anthophora quadrimaculata]